MDERLKKFIEDDWNWYEKEITLDTWIEDDLGITGDDAFEFINDFANKFNIDISEFSFLNYFRPEGWLLFPHKYRPITLQYLQEALNCGKLK